MRPKSEQSQSRGESVERVRHASAMIATEIIEFATVQPAFEAEGRRLGMQPEELGFDLFTMEYARDLNQREPSVAGGGRTSSAHQRDPSEDQAQQRRKVESRRSAQ